MPKKLTLERNKQLTWDELCSILRKTGNIRSDEEITEITLMHPKEMRLYLRPAEEVKA